MEAFEQEIGVEAESRELQDEEGARGQWIVVMKRREARKYVSQIQDQIVCLAVSLYYEPLRHDKPYLPMNYPQSTPCVEPLLSSALGRASSVKVTNSVVRKGG